MNEILEEINLCTIEVIILGNNVEFINSSKYVDSGKINELLDRVMGIDPPMAVKQTSIACPSNGRTEVVLCSFDSYIYLFTVMQCYYRTMLSWKDY